MIGRWRRDSRRRWWGAAALLAIAALTPARPGRAAQTPDGAEPVDHGYRLQLFDGRLDKDPFRLYLLTRAAASHGRLRVCGLYVADMSDARYVQLNVDLRDGNSALRFGVPDRRGVRVRPGFLAARRAVVLEDRDGEPRLPGDLQASCVATDAPWEDRFAVEPVTLELTQSRLRSLLLQYWR
jgi:hypothetical protein